jgi:arabinan endo-1,5-alpha-L-arabinosidase
VAALAAVRGQVGPLSSIELAGTADRRAVRQSRWRRGIVGSRAGSFASTKQLIGAKRLLGGFLAIAALLAAAVPAGAASHNYRNPLDIRIPGDGRVESCADPTVIRGTTPGDRAWFMYCTTDPLNSDDKSGGNFNFHPIPMFRSTDLVTWRYQGDALASRPAWAEPTAGLWAPEIQFFNGQYYLYFGVTDVKPEISGEPEGCHDDNAIGVATSSSPLGPWTVSPTPVVEPRRNGPGCNFFWTFDPDVITAQDTAHLGQRYIYYGSYYGGVQVRELSPDGLLSIPASAVQVAIPNRYEGSEVIYRNGFYYYLGSATNCCNGPLTGYSVFAGRSESPTGPFIDRDGVSLLNGRVGGSVFLSMNGNKWVGPGHQTTFKDFDGQWWTIYHAIDRNDPYFDGAVGFTKRPALLDPVEWIGGWPSVRGGQWASIRRIKRPAARPGDETLHVETRARRLTPGDLLDSDEFNGSIDGGWTWVREPASTQFRATPTTFQFDTQAADLFVDSNNASVLLRDLPSGNWIAETRLQINLPPEGCCYNYVQAGVVVYDDDDNFLKLAHVSIWETRQTEWAKEEAPVPGGYPRYGNTVVTAPGDWTYFRIARRERRDDVLYQAFVSRDGTHWNRGGVWTHELADPSIGLVSMGGSGFTADFDYLRIYSLEVGP